MRSPNWKKEEVMLTLNLYLTNGIEWVCKISDKTSDVIALSELLNALDLIEEEKPEKFRSTGSIRMKIANFMALDPKYSGALGNVGHLDKEVWNKYCNHPTKLKEECIQIISRHLLDSKKNDRITEYIEKYLYSKSSVDFSAFCLDIKEQAEIFLAEADKKGDSQIKECCERLIQYTKAFARVEDEYVEHGGVNRKPIVRNEIKIGQLVKNALDFMISEMLIDETDLNNFMSADWSRRVFHLSHPFIISVDSTKDITEQLKDANGYVRYWKKIYIINGNEYAACKEWYEEQRKYFQPWFEEYKSLKRMAISEKDLKAVLEYIKIIDENDVCIKQMDIISKFNTIDNIDDLISYLKKKGVLTSFQGSTREFVIDDYDLFFRMLTNPKEYIL